MTKWQPDGKYIKAALELLQNMKFCSRLSDDPDLFVLAEKHVSREERFVLMKAFLKADLEIGPNEEDASCISLPSWVKCWRSSAEETTDWDQIKRSLLHTDLKGHFSKETRYHCFLIVLAERLLGDTKAQLERWRAQAEPLSPSESESAKHCRWQYIRILKEFYNTEAQLNPIFYKYAVQIRDWDLTLAEDVEEQQRKEIALLVEKQAKYRQVIALFTHHPHHTIDDSLDSFLKDANRKSLKD